MSTCQDYYIYFYLIPNGITSHSAELPVTIYEDFMKLTLILGFLSLALSSHAVACPNFSGSYNGVVEEQQTTAQVVQKDCNLIAFFVGGEQVDTIYADGTLRDDESFEAAFPGEKNCFKIKSYWSGNKLVKEDASTGSCYMEVEVEAEKYAVYKSVETFELQGDSLKIKIDYFTTEEKPVKSEEHTLTKIK